MKTARVGFVCSSPPSKCTLRKAALLRSGGAGATKLLPLLLLLTLPVGVQAQFTYTINNGAVTITGYTGPGGAVIIPSGTNGLPVTSIGDNALAYGYSLTSVTIPDSVTYPTRFYRIRWP